MRREIPRHVDVLLNSPRFEAPRVDVANIADVASLNDVHDLPNHGRIEKVWPTISTRPWRLAMSITLFAILPELEANRLLNERMFARQEAGLGQWV